MSTWGHIFQSWNNWVGTIKKWVFMCIVLYVIVALGMAWTGWGKWGSATAHVSNSERLIATARERYIQVYQSEDDAVKLRAHTVAGFFCSMIGEFCDGDPHTKTQTDSLIHTASSFLAMPFAHPPASGIAWFKDTMEHIGIVPQSYAQGIGFNALGSYKEVWKIMRNMSLLLITLAITVSGFVVIFGFNVGEKASVTIETMLPRLVITLIMVSLSYAIVGFMIDMMYAVLFLVFNVLAPIMNIDASAQSRVLVMLVSGQPNSLWTLMHGTDAATFGYVDAGTALYQLMPSAAQAVVSGIVYNVGMPLIAIGLSAVIPGLSAVGNVAKAGSFVKLANRIAGKKVIEEISDTKTTGVAIVAEILLAIVSIVEWFGMPFLTPVFIGTLLYITTIYLFFKVWFTLFSFYVEIVMSTIFAPLYITMHALPGSKSMTSWFKNLAINLACFPAVLALMMIAGFIANMNGNDSVTSTRNFWTPPFLNSIGSQTALQVITGTMLFYNIPLFIQKFRETLGYEKSSFADLKLSSLAAPAIGFVTSGYGLMKTAADWNDKLGKRAANTGH